MHSLTDLARWISQAYTGRSVGFTIWAAGMVAPTSITAMYLRGESPEYMAQAAYVLSCGAGA